MIKWWGAESVKKRVRTYKQSVVNAIVLAVAICLFVYAIYQVVGGFSAKVSTQRTQTVTDNEYTYLRGYVFRNESVIEQDGSGVVDRLVPDGERLGVGKRFADFYSVPETSTQDVEKLQQDLDTLSGSIDLLDSQMDSGKFVSDLAYINEDLVKYYYSYSEAIVDGDVSSSDRYGAALLDSIIAYRTVTDRDGKIEDVSSALDAERDAIISSLGVAPKAFVAEEGCHFFYGCDGYEDVFSTDRLEDLTIATLNQLVDSDPKTFSGTAIGRLVHDPKWYICLPCDSAEMLRFSVGATYDVIFTDSDSRSIPMLLERTVTDESGSYLLLSSLDMSVSHSFSRAQNVKILTDSVTGYRVPSQALHQRNGESGVYVLVGSIAEFRRVTVIGEGNGYYIVNTNEADIAEGVNSETPYLAPNDLIITSGNDLYDGKHFN